MGSKSKTIKLTLVKLSIEILVVWLVVVKESGDILYFKEQEDSIFLWEWIGVDRWVKQVMKVL